MVSLMVLELNSRKLEVMASTKTGLVHRSIQEVSTHMLVVLMTMMLEPSIRTLGVMELGETALLMTELNTQVVEVESMELWKVGHWKTMQDSMEVHMDLQMKTMEVRRAPK